MAIRKEENYAGALLRYHTDGLSECSTNLTKLIYKLYSVGILSKEDCEELETQGTSTFQRFANLYTRIPRIGTNWLNALVVAWIYSENASAIQLVLGKSIEELEDISINRFTNPKDFKITLSTKRSLVTVESITWGNNPDPAVRTLTSGASNGIWYGISDLIHNFTGREYELETLHGLVTEGGSKNESCYALLTSIYGLGGIGKTTLARKYAWTYASYFENNVIWIHSETKAMMISAFTDLANLLHINNYDKLPPKERANCVYEWFSDKKSLFIFDNVEEIDGVHGVNNFLPIGVRNKPCIIITSRRSDLVQTKRVLRLDVLSEADAIALLQNQDCLPNATNESYANLYETLGCLPLALQQAISYIRSTLGLHRNADQAMDSYLNEYRAQGAKLLGSNFASSDGYQNTVSITWNITLKRIKKDRKNGGLAKCLIDILAYMYPEKIEVEYVLNLVSEFQFPQKVKPVMESDIRSAIGILAKYSLITLENGVVSMHRLLQLVVKLRCKFEETIVKHIVKFLCYTDQNVEQNALHRMSILPYFEKYKLEPNYPSFRNNSQVMEYINDQIVGTNRSDALALVKRTGCWALTVEVAVKFINEMAIENGFALYIRACELLHSKITAVSSSEMRIIVLSKFLLLLKLTGDNIEAKYVTKLLLQLSLYWMAGDIPKSYMKAVVKILGGDFNLVDIILATLIKYDVYQNAGEDFLYSNMTWYTGIRSNAARTDSLILNWFCSSAYLEQSVEVHDFGKLGECATRRVEPLELNNRPHVEMIDIFTQVFYIMKETRKLQFYYFILEAQKLNITFNELMMVCFISETKFLQRVLGSSSDRYLELYLYLLGRMGNRYFFKNTKPLEDYMRELWSTKLKSSFDALAQVSSSLDEDITDDQLNSIVLQLRDTPWPPPPRIDSKREKTVKKRYPIA